MAIVNIVRPAIFNSTNNRFEQTYLTKNTDGTISRRTSIVEDTENQAIKNSATEAATEAAKEISAANFFVDTNLIQGNNLTYSTVYDFLEDSISIYCNGLNVTKDVTIGLKEFTFPGDYNSIIDEDSIVFATYVKL